jgi:iron-sulfur cluster assembly protein
MITITETAQKKILANLAKRGRGVGIRVGVRTTGCSGMAYVLEYVDEYNGDNGTINYAQEKFVVLVDMKDNVYLDGMEIDYVRQGLNEGFEFSNPNEKDRCGCGESFRI